MRRRVLILSVLLVLGGVLVSPTAAFSTVDADRATSVTVAPDDEALLAFNGTGNTVTDKNTPTTVAVLRNNLGETVTVTYEVTTTNAGTAAERDGEVVSDTPAPGDTADVDVRCDPPGGGAGTAEVVVTVSEADAANVAIRDADLTATFGYDCPGNGGGNGTGNGGNNGRGSGA